MVMMIANGTCSEDILDTKFAKVYADERELTGIARAEAAEAMAILFDTSYNYYGGSYDRYDVRDEKGRNWKIVYDSSIHKVNHD